MKSTWEQVFRELEVAVQRLREKQDRPENSISHLEQKWKARQCNNFRTKMKRKKK